ncbi:hypothetical protein AIOL_004743 [Candidatus Rhodobacter oscarellae]|uniref:SnoaL-like domain-containing protein n=1 Tax=Candidatus Rhodobacter oscarellae TaxID=1675527 RepID=A0A0J9EAE4_9RHOB|nr:hypothetical protein [Candidatus Rhodobacter lobularis]KMW59760.1 hypothetical protein AIOL_004743 [Candidatus Rhodobacter lobularis]
MTLEQPEAEAIVAHLMQEAKGSVLDNAFERFLAICHLPLETGTFEGHRVLRTTSELKQLFQEFVDYYALNQITDTIRTPISIEARDENVILCTHESWHVSSQQLLKNKMTAFTEIHRRNGVWAVTRSYYASEGSAQFHKTLEPRPARSSDLPNSDKKDQSHG